jgi:hypothetical protein
MATATENKTEISLKGSVGIVSEFFFTAINSILYQRGKFLFMELVLCLYYSSILLTVFTL